MMRRTMQAAALRHAIVLLSMLAVSTLPHPATAARPSVFFPVKSVVCDRKSRTCYDFLGASVPLTKAHMGDNAANALTQRINRAGKKWNPNRFVLSNGVECLLPKKACFVRAGSDEIDQETTEQLFGGH